MGRLPPPATGVEMYLAAILEQLRVIAGLLEGGGQEKQPEPGAAAAPQVSPTKRTRQRTRTAA